MEKITKRIKIRGTVQGVGFRPFVFRLAQLHGISGTVRNDGQGVEIVVSGPPDTMTRFEAGLAREAPPLSSIRNYESAILKDNPDLEDFQIIETDQGPVSHAEAGRDTAVCDDCIREMRDPGNRRFRHPFINCTNCGPRYTLIRSLPYDRPATTMAVFPMCSECKKEYKDPLNRRFHTQPVCCPQCGPHLEILDARGTKVDGPDPVSLCVEKLSRGHIVVIKGVGGFHLACRADSSEAVLKLRQKKHREEKPFAIMVKDSHSAKQLGHLSSHEIRLLESPERPIVLVEKKPETGLADQVAPGVNSHGIFLPYAPVHHMLFDEAPYSALVMTSANQSEEPIIHTNAAAIKKLSGLADFFLLHNRDILLRNDDSISRVINGAPVLLRRARGFVPESLPAGVDVQGIVATGGILKSTVTVGRGDRCHISQYLGNLQSLEVLENFEAVLGHLLSLLQVQPEIYAADLHPDALGRRAAEESGLPVELIQHHHAHAAACLAENGVNEPALAIVYDGTGYGSDGTIWGGEFLVIDGPDFRRVGHWAPMPMPGGDAAIIHPGRMALGAICGKMGVQSLARCSWLTNPEKEAVLSLMGPSCPLTSSVGRLYDSLSAMLGLCPFRSYEGQPAMLLEGIADPRETEAYSCSATEDSGRLILDGGDLLCRALEEIERRENPKAIAARFQNGLIKASAESAIRLMQSHGLAAVCLSGGCFQNAVLAEGVKNRIEEAGFRVYTHRLISPNDEGISYGQAVIAAKRRLGARQKRKGVCHAGQV